MIKHWSAFLAAAGLIAVVLWGSGLTQQRPVAEDAPVSKRPASTAMGSPANNRLPVAPAAGQDAVLPAVPQRLFLVATSPGRNAREGTAQIGTDPKRPQTYTGGAVLANGAQLTEIYQTHVVLERDGRRFELHIDARLNAASELAAVGGPTPASAAHVTPVDDGLSGVLRSMPVYDGDVLVGLQVFAGKQASAFQQLGLRSGDIIVALDGAPVADANDALDILRTLAGGVAMTATVRRQNTTTTIAMNGAVLAPMSKPQTASLTGVMTQ